MNDTFYEQIVKRKTRPADIGIKVLCIVGIVILALASVFLGPLMLLAAIVFGIVVVMVIFPRLHVEYEYALLNHDLNVDIIYNMSKRKHVMSIDLKEAEIIAPRKSHRLDSYHNFQVKDLSTADEAETPMAIMCPIAQQMTCILVNPDQEMIQRMAAFLPRTLYRD